MTESYEADRSSNLKEIKEESSKYSAVVALPYTSRIDKHGKIRISSHTALLLDAVLTLYQKKVAPIIFIPGENTFGREYISTSSLMKEWFIKRGVPEEKIVAADNLNNTEEQLYEVKRQGLVNPLIVCLGFHKKRVESLARRMRIKGKIEEADPIIIEKHGVSPKRLKKFIGAKDRFPGGISKIYTAEAIGKTGERLGELGRFAVKYFRMAMGAQGATVTDFHNVEPATKHLGKAEEENRAPEKLAV